MSVLTDPTFFVGEGDPFISLGNSKEVSLHLEII